jgi:transcriptional regulator with XRE-family HTH domain
MKDLRLNRELTQVELSRLSGVTQKMISDYETGARPVRNMTLDTAERLAKALRVPIEKLLKD